jgi:hypothetical protein
MVENKSVAAIAILTMLLGVGGGALFLTPEQYNSAYYCNVSSIAMFCDRLSSTSTTCYYQLDGINKSKSCTKSKWISLKTYSEQNNININELIQNNTNRQADKPLEWICDNKNCYCKINNE